MKKEKAVTGPNIVELHKYKCLDCSATSTSEKAPEKCENPTCPSNRPKPMPAVDSAKLIEQQKAARAEAKAARLQQASPKAKADAKVKAEADAKAKVEADAKAKADAEANKK
ncbi:MAG: hypothetical protein PHY02_09775 [Phycisphaerae bacterium]|nr:hypothetical protein [Phycisphaerae bacterium]